VRLPIAMRRSVRGHSAATEDLFADFHHGLLMVQVTEETAGRAPSVRPRSVHVAVPGRGDGRFGFSRATRSVFGTTQFERNAAIVDALLIGGLVGQSFLERPPLDWAARYQL
jgi:hypothetical protein